MAKRRITQETFDAAIKENMEEFEMDAEEALKDAVEQFESQGNVTQRATTATPFTASRRFSMNLYHYEAEPVMSLL